MIYTMITILIIVLPFSLGAFLAFLARLSEKRTKHLVSNAIAGEAYRTSKLEEKIKSLECRIGNMEADRIGELAREQVENESLK